MKISKKQKTHIKEETNRKRISSIHIITITLLIFTLIIIRIWNPLKRLLRGRKSFFSREIKSRKLKICSKLNDNIYI
jgi:hypothetical protein